MRLVFIGSCFTGCNDRRDGRSDNSCRHEIPHLADPYRCGIHPHGFIPQHLPKHDLVDAHVNHDGKPGEDKRPTVGEQGFDATRANTPGVELATAPGNEGKEAERDEQRFGEACPDESQEWSMTQDHTNFDGGQYQKYPVFDPHNVTRLHLGLKPVPHHVACFEDEGVTQDSDNQLSERIVGAQQANGKDSKAECD